jgi:hypothetical protein
MAKKAKEIVVGAIQVSQSRMKFTVIGKQPMVYHAMSMKDAQSLLLPPKRKTTAEKSSTLKHNPPEEYFNSTYRRRPDEKGATRLLMPGRIIKASISEAAKRTPGATGTEVRQLVRVDDIMCDLYGVPQIYMAIVRQTDIKRTPDVRTRAIVQDWCCSFSVTYTTPQLNADAVVALVANSGLFCGWGDDRLQKGGSFGGFEIVDHDDKRVKAIMESGGMKEQDAALKDPECYDVETETMYTWWQSEVKRRDFKIVPAA